MKLQVRPLEIAPLRIGISGAPGVGKTVLCERLKEVLSGDLELDVVVSEEVARSLMAKGVKINTESTVEDYLAFLAEHIRQMRTLRGEVVLLDRTILDVYAFMHITGHTGGWLESLADELIQWQMTSLKLYCYIPREFDVENDGVRIVDPRICQALDAAIVDLLDRYWPGFVVLKGDLATRVNRIVQEVLIDEDVLKRRM